MAKASIYREGEADLLLRQVVTFLEKDPYRGRLVWGQSAGYYFLTGRKKYTGKAGDPNLSSDTLPKGSIILWDSWSSGRWARIPLRRFARNPYYQKIKEFRGNQKNHVMVLFEKLSSGYKPTDSP